MFEHSATTSTHRMKTKRRLTITGMAIGALLMLSPLFGMLGTFFGMKRAFDILGSSGVGDPSALSASIGDTLIFTAAGVLLFPLGAVILTLSLVCFLRLAPSNPPPLPLQP